MQRPSRKSKLTEPIKQPTDATDNQRRKSEASDPFSTFIEWSSEADERAYSSLSHTTSPQPARAARL